jgi:hypothetical protein
MGFRIPEVIRTITFDNPSHPFHGLEVKLRGPSVDFIASFGDLADLRDIDLSAGFTPEKIDLLRRPLQMFAALLVDWNLTDENDVIIPPTAVGMAAYDMQIIAGIMRECMSALSGVPEDLKDESSAGLNPEDMTEIPLPMTVG